MLEQVGCGVRIHLFRGLHRQHEVHQTKRRKGLLRTPPTEPPTPTPSRPKKECIGTLVPDSTGEVPTACLAV